MSLKVTMGCNGVFQRTAYIAILTIIVLFADRNCLAAGTRIITDSAGRQLVVPVEIERVFAAGPPAAILLYTLAPDKLLGWSREVRPAERAFMPEKYADLPVLGRLTGKGNTANIETVIAARPDVILDVGRSDPT